MGSNPKLIIVAGTTSGCGKTSVAEALIQVVSKRGPTGACKITVTHGDRGCPHGGKGCNVCSGLGGDFQVIDSPSVIKQQGTDTARFFEVGARPVLWIITRDIHLQSSWDAAASWFYELDFVVVESNSLATIRTEAVRVMAVDPTARRRLWKDSASDLITTANLLVFNHRGTDDQVKTLWDEVNVLRDRDARTLTVSHPHELASDSILKEVL
jgi:hypothetical protein